MDYEKKLAEALEELKQCARYDTEPAKTILKLFPELEESDYVIKRRLRHLLDYFRCKGVDHNVCDRILKWLDKQDEQESTDKIEPRFQTGDTMRTLEEARDGFTSGMPMIISIDDEYYHCTNESIAIKDQDNYEYPPINRKEEKSDIKINHKFKPGDWIVNKSGHAFLIGAVGDDKYLFVDGGYTHEKLNWEFIKNADEHYTIWNFNKNAEDGMMLVYNDDINMSNDPFYIFIYKKSALYQAYCYYSRGANDIFFEENGKGVHCCLNMYSVKPATKKQRDFLQSRLKERNYEWDAKDKIFTYIDPWGNYDPLDDYVNQ